MLKINYSTKSLEYIKKLIPYNFTSNLLLGLNLVP